MIPDRKKKKYVSRRKEYSEKKHRAGFSAGRKYLPLLSALVLVTVLRQTSTAQDLGGFHVETLPGESTGIPSDWEVGDGLQDFGEQQQSEENGYEDMFGSGEGNWQEDIYEEPEIGSGSEWENNIENTEETDEDDMQETAGQHNAGQLQENLSETEETNQTGTEGLQEMPPYRAQFPVKTAAPTTASDTASGTGTVSDLYEEEEIRKNDRDKESETFRNQFHAVPEVLYWKGTITNMREPVLSIKEGRDIQILSLRANGKESGWIQEKNRIYLKIPDKGKTLQKVFQIELAFLSYNGTETGIYVDVPGKS